MILHSTPTARKQPTQPTFAANSPPCFQRGVHAKAAYIHGHNFLGHQHCWCSCSLRQRRDPHPQGLHLALAQAVLRRDAGRPQMSCSRPRRAGSHPACRGRPTGRRLAPRPAHRGCQPEGLRRARGRRGSRSAPVRPVPSQPERSPCHGRLGPPWARLRLRPAAARTARLARRRSQSWPRRQWAPTTRLARRITRALRPCGTFRCAENVVGDRRCVQGCSLAPWEARF